MHYYKNKKMTTYYTIQCWRHRQLEWQSHTLYETFDEACDALEKNIHSCVDYDASTFEKNKPNREEKVKIVQNVREVLYFKSPDGYEFSIRDMKVIYTQ